MNVQVESNIVEFQRMFQRYTELNSRAPEELMEKKGRALGIKLFEGFREHQFGGNPKRKGIAAEELRQRSSQGRGIRVRPSLRKRYEQGREHLTYSVRSFGQVARRSLLLSDYMEAKRDGRAARKRRSALWKKAVGMELAARESGIGMLAASFLWYRKRQSQAKGTFTVPNRTGKPLGYVDRGEGFLRIVSEADGIDVVDARYGIVQAALQRETADMAEYITKKEREIFGVAFQK